jgi:hypothetical protein
MPARFHGNCARYTSTTAAQPERLMLRTPAVINQARQVAFLDYPEHTGDDDTSDRCDGRFLV